MNASADRARLAVALAAAVALALSLSLSLATATAGCIPAREPARHLGGEAYFLGAYVQARTSACGDPWYELALAPRPARVTETYPATYESMWELRACGQAIRLTLDCAMLGETWACRARDWPTPLVAPDYALAHEIEAVARRAPECPAERSCRKPQCSEDGLVVRRLASDRAADVGRYEVARCGVVASVNVRCTREAPFQCVTVASSPVDMARP